MLSRRTHARRRRPIDGAREANTWPSEMRDVIFIGIRRIIPEVATNQAVATTPSPICVVFAVIIFGSVLLRILAAFDLGNKSVTDS